MKKRNRSKNKKMDTKKMSILIIFLVLAVFAVSIAYSALSQSLSISFGNVTQSAMSWNVAFQTGTVSGTEGGSGPAGRSCGDATVTSNSVSVASTTLSKPDDSCTYTLVIKNTGTINAVLSNITPIFPSSIGCTTSGASMVCDNITYSLATSISGSPLLTLNSTIAKSTGVQYVYLIIKYTGLEPVTTDVNQSNGGFTLVYNQA